jgi:uncharacterized protein (DUF1684 family)
MVSSDTLHGFVRAAALLVLNAALVLDVAAAVTLQDENSRIADWRAKRLASLTSETGWLTPIALYWLKEGENSFGRTSTNAFAIHDAAPAPHSGVFILTQGRVRYVAHAPKTMSYLGKPVASIELVSDAHETPTELVAGYLHFLLIERRRIGNGMDASLFWRGVVGGSERSR